MNGKVIHLDEVGTGGTGGTGTGWSGEALNFSSLPFFTDHIGEVYLVKESQGSQIFFNLKRSGFYIAEPTEWRKLSKAQFMFKDDELTFSDSTDDTKQLGFQLDQISTGTRRIATFPNKNGTVAYLDDLIEEAPSDGSIYLRNGQGQLWQKLLGMCQTFDLAAKEGNQNANSGDFHGVFCIMGQGFYNKATVQTTSLNLGVTQSFILRVSYYRSSDSSLISQGELTLNSSRNGLTRHDINLNTPFNINTAIEGVYCVVGVNENIGGGTVQITRINANQLNDVNTAFQFQLNSGDMPLSLPVRNSTNNVRWQIVYGS